MSDTRSGISSVAYNELNLPQSVTFTGGEADYLYLSDGTKLAALKDGSGLIYCGSMVYSCAFSGTAPAVDFESTEFSAGRMVKKAGAVQPEYHVNDYLCSVRVVTDADGEVLERNDYSGFGKRLASSAVTPAAGSANRYRFSGKEEQEFAGVPWQDFGARMYDPDLARWTTPDPLAEKYPGISPYVYCNDNPVNFVDPDGEKLYFANGVSDTFKKKFKEVIKFMNSKGTSGDIAKLHNSKTIYYIDEAVIEKGKHWSAFDPQQKTIYWDPDILVETPDNIYVSPATILAHESAHAVKYDEILQSNDATERKQYINSVQSIPDYEYFSKEEFRVITGPEQTAARKHREIRNDQVTRKSHKNSKLIPIPDGISFEELSKSIFEHNNLL